MRTGEAGSYAFYLNNTLEAVSLPGITGRDLVTDREVAGELTLPACGVAVVHTAAE